MLSRGDDERDDPSRPAREHDRVEEGCWDIRIFHVSMMTSTQHATRDPTTHNRVGALIQSHLGDWITNVGPGRTSTVHGCPSRWGGCGWPDSTTDDVRHQGTLRTQEKTQHKVARSNNDYSFRNNITIQQKQQLGRVKGQSVPCRFCGAPDNDGHLFWECNFPPLVEIRENPEFHDLMREDKVSLAQVSSLACLATHAFWCQWCFPLGY